MRPGAIDGGEAYEELGELYDAWCAEVAEDLPFYAGLASSLAADLGRESLDVLELGAGSGRVAVPLAAAGHRVTALDASPAQLGRLEAYAQATGAAERITTHAADMRSLEGAVGPGTTDLVLVPFRGLLHVTADRTTVLAAAARVLRPGGVLAFDVFHPDDAQVASTDGRWLHRRAAHTERGSWRFDERARYAPAEHVEPGARSLSVDVRARWRPARRLRRGSAHALDVLPDPPADAPHQRSTVLQLTLVPAEHWRTAIEAAGLEVDGAYGWFDASPFAPGDDDSIWVARRPAG